MHVRPATHEAGSGARCLGSPAAVVPRSCRRPSCGPRELVLTRVDSVDDAVVRSQLLHKLAKPLRDYDSESGVGEIEDLSFRRWTQTWGNEDWQRPENATVALCRWKPPYDPPPQPAP